MTQLSPELLTMALAALPFTELRAALPIAVGKFGLSVSSAFGYSVIGNFLPVPLLLWSLPVFVRWTSRHWTWAHRALDRYFFRLKARHGEKFERAGMVAIAVFVAIPLPGTGAWTAAVLSVLFGISPKYAYPGILVGIIGAGAIVSLITTGALGAASWLL